MKSESRNSERVKRVEKPQYLQNRPWYLYILCCSDNSYYIGITPNVQKRLEIHNSGKGSRYSRGRLPARVVYSKKLRNKSEARKREIQIKHWSRKKKEGLIKGDSI